MSTLRELVEGRKAELAADVRCVEKEIRPVAMVIFYPWQAAIWALPWSRLEGVKLDHLGEQEQIGLLFPHHCVVIVGENLRGTLKSLTTFEISSVRALPVSHRARMRPTEPFIERLDVRLLGEAKRLFAEPGPFGSA